MCIRFLIGSNDGQVCVWKCGEGFRSLEPCFSIPLVSGSLQVGVTSIIDWALERTHTHVHAHNYSQCTNRPPVNIQSSPFRGIFLELSCNALTHMQTTPIVTIPALCALCVTPSPSFAEWLCEFPDVLSRRYVPGGSHRAGAQTGTVVDRQVSQEHYCYHTTKTLCLVSYGASFSK